MWCCWFDVDLNLVTYPSCSYVFPYWFCVLINEIIPLWFFIPFIFFLFNVLLNFLFFHLMLINSCACWCFRTYTTSLFLLLVMVQKELKDYWMLLYTRYILLLLTSILHQRIPFPSVGDWIKKSPNSSLMFEIN